jgi:uncharacterized membrane protein
MKSLERIILLSALIAIICVGGVWALKFYTPALTTDQSIWAALGDYFGGILNPILSFLLIILIINEAIDSRKSFFESKTLQLKSQKQIDEQIELLRPRPELVYYLHARGSMVYATVENIGNATAYNIRIDFQFDGKVENWPAVMFERLKSYQYYPPKYKSSVFVGHVLIDHTVTGIPTHATTINYSESSEQSGIQQKKIYQIDSNMLGSLHREQDYQDMLKDIATELKRVITSK